MPSRNDPSRSTEPFGAAPVPAGAESTEVDRLTTDADKTPGDDPRTSDLGPLPSKVRSFEDERDVVGALPESSLAQSDAGRYDPHVQASQSAEPSDTTKRQAQLHDGDVEYRAEGRNPLAEAVFGDVNPDADVAQEVPEVRGAGTSDVAIGDRALSREGSESTLHSDDPRQLSPLHAPGPAPADVQPATADVDADARPSAPVTEKGEEAEAEAQDAVDSSDVEQSESADQAAREADVDEVADDAGSSPLRDVVEGTEES